MSLRPSEVRTTQGLVVVDATFAAARCVTGGRRSTRLDKVLRATHVPTTGACLPRGFDPDYCAYDGYYAIGVTLVSAVLGALVDLPQTWVGYGQVAKALNEVLGRMCHTPKEEGWVYANPQAKQYHAMNRDEKMDAKKSFGPLCHVLEMQLSNEEQFSEIFSEWGSGSWRGLAGKILWLITKPGLAMSGTLNNLANPLPENQPTSRNPAATRAAMLASAAWSLKYISRFMNEHALMIASFLRVNAKNMRTGAPLMLDLASFVRQCKEDIADGANPPPQPPAYEDFNPAAVVAERRMADLRKRAEERDPAMEGVDYPPVYASAGDAPLSDLHSGAALGKKMNS